MRVGTLICNHMCHGLMFGRVCFHLDPWFSVIFLVYLCFPGFLVMVPVLVWKSCSLCVSLLYLYFLVFSSMVIACLALMCFTRVSLALCSTLLLFRLCPLSFCVNPVFTSISSFVCLGWFLVCFTLCFDFLSLGFIKLSLLENLLPWSLSWSDFQKLLVPQMLDENNIYHYAQIQGNLRET